MAITRRPKGPAQSAIDIESLINKGGSSPTQDLEDRKATVAVVLRVPADVLRRVDVAVMARPIRTPRHTWLLEALHEKLQREEHDIV